MELLLNYHKAIKEIYDHVGFHSEYLNGTIDDCTTYFWYTDGISVSYGDSEDKLKTEGGDFYVDDILGERYYGVHCVYVGDKITMIICEYYGQLYFRIFDNTRRIS